MCNTQKMMMVGLGALAVVATGPAGLALWGSTAATTAPVVLDAELAAGAGLGIGATTEYAIPAATDGITGQTLLTGMSLAGTGLSTYGALENGRVQKEIGNRNADAAKKSADEVLRRGVAQADVVAGQGRQAAGQQAAIMGASGVDPTTGTMSTVRDATAVGTNLAASYALDKALNQAWSLDNQATNDRYMGEATSSASKVSAFDTLLTGGRRAYGVFKGYKEPYGYGA